MDRQAILARESPPLLWCVIDEAVLRRPVGGPEAAREQLKRLVEAADTTSVVLQVLPSAVIRAAALPRGASLDLLRAIEYGP
jgi:hypothetical protein